MAIKKLISIRSNVSDLKFLKDNNISKTKLWQDAVDEVKLKATKEKKLKSSFRGKSK